MFKMKDEYRIGITHIDEQHEMLFDTVEMAYQLLMDNNSIDKYDEILEIIANLKAYTVTHFKDEEAYMERINYSEIEVQRAAHKEFIQMVEAINIEDFEHDQDEYIMGILEFLYQWLTDHIIKQDLLIVSAH